MQLLSERGLEFVETPGLGWIKGEVRAIEPKDPALKIPHMGWNTLNVVNAHALLDGIPTGPNGWHAYFVHSFAMVPKERRVVVAETDYGGRDHGARCGRQYRRHAVPSREEPEARSQADREFPGLEALEAFSACLHLLVRIHDGHRGLARDDDRGELSCERADRRLEHVPDAAWHVPGSVRLVIFEAALQPVQSSRQEPHRRGRARARQARRGGRRGSRGGA